MSDQHQLFEQLKQIDENGMEFWSARSISKLLNYSEYRHFQPVITKAKEACINSEHAIEDHFEDILATVTIGSGAQQAGVEANLDFAIFQNHGYKGLWWIRSKSHSCTKRTKEKPEDSRPDGIDRIGS